MKIAITGGAGFIGYHVQKRLQQEACEVVLIDNLSTGKEGNILPGVRLIKADIRDSMLEEVFLREKFTSVIHLAAQTSVPASIQDPYNDCDVNLAGLLRILNCCRHGVKRVIFPSSAAVYGNVLEDSLPIQEMTPLMPESFYGLTKLTGEKYLALYQQNFGLEYIGLRCANVYGERQGALGEGGVINIFNQSIRKEKRIHILGDGGQTRDFVYAGDVAEAMWKGICTEKPNQIYNVSTQIETSINQLATLFCHVAKEDVQITYGPPREGDIYRSVLANEKIIRDWLWQPSMPLAEGLERLYRDGQGI